MRQQMVQSTENVSTQAIVSFQASVDFDDRLEDAEVGVFAEER